MKLILYQATIAITKIDFGPGPFRCQIELGHLDFAVAIAGSDITFAKAGQITGSCSHAWSTHIRTNNQVESEEGTTLKLPLVTACVCETFIRTSNRAQSMRFPPHSNKSVCPKRHTPFRPSSSRRHSSVKYKSNDAGESGGEGELKASSARLRCVWCTSGRSCVAT